jgi:hypothetical protein
VNTLDFNSSASGTAILDGDTLAGLTFQYSIPGVTLQVRDTTGSKAANHLGTDEKGNFGQFVAGDNWSISLAPARAFGARFRIDRDAEVHDGDILLQTALGVAGNDNTPEGPSKTGSLPYFIGFVTTEPEELITQIDVRFDPSAIGALLYVVDDIVWVEAAGTVPEPATALSALIALGVTAGVIRLRHARQSAG